MEMVLATREAVVQFLAGNSLVGLLVAAGSIHGERVPDNRTFPMVIVQPPSSIPFRTSCHNGEQVIFNISAFAGGPSMDDAAEIGGVIKSVLDGATLTIDGVKTSVIWTGGNIIRDAADPDLWHHFNSFVVN